MRRILAGLLSVCVSLSAVGAELPTASLTTHALPAELALDISPAAIEQGNWWIHRSDHFDIVFGSDPARAAMQAELLETTYRRFFEAFEGFGITPVTDPLICLFFENKHDYLHYAQRVDRVDMSWTVAYYSARTNRIAFYRYGRPGLVANHHTASAAAHDNQLLVSAVTESRAHDAHPVSLASATHEAAHQLAFNGGLQKRGVRYPLWVSEGLATNFEMTDAHSKFGPAYDNPSRRHRLQQLDRLGALQPLSRFVTQTHPPTDDARATDAVYAQAWGLFRFLYQERPDDLSQYLADLRALPRGERSPAVLRAEFIHRFGPMEDVEHQWQAWIAAMTP